MGGDVALKLKDEAAVELVGHDGELEVVVGDIDDMEQAVLDARVRVFKAQIENAGTFCGMVEERLAGADADAESQAEPALSDFRGAREHHEASGDELLDEPGDACERAV